MACETEKEKDQLRSFCKETIKRDPENRGAFQYVCTGYEGEIDFACLTVYCEQVLREHPKNPAALRCLSVARHRLGQEEQAMQALQRLREIDPQQAHELEAVLKQP